MSRRSDLDRFGEANGQVANSATAGAAAANSSTTGATTSAVAPASGGLTGRLRRFDPRLLDRRSGKRVLDFVSTAGFTVAIVGVHLVQGILLARLLGPDGRGSYAAAMLYVQLLTYVGLMGGLDVICRAAASRTSRASSGSDDAVPDESLWPLRRSAFRLGATTGVITAVVAIVLSVVAIPADKRDVIPWAILSATSLIGLHITLVYTGVDRGVENLTAYNIRRFIAAVAFPVLVIVAACFGTVTVPVACGAFVAGSVISVAACLIDRNGLQIRKMFGRSDTPVPRLLGQSGPYGLSMLATELFERLDLLLVLWLAPIVQQGYYAAMVPAVYPLTVIPNTLGVFLFNRGTDAGRRLTVSELHRVMAASIGVQAVVTITFMLLIGWVVRLFYGEAFGPAVVYALWLAPASAIRGILQGLDAYLKGRGRPMVSVTTRITAMVVTLVTTAILFPVHGVVSIAMATLLGQVVCLIGLTAILYVDCYRGDQSEHVL